MELSFSRQVCRNMAQRADPSLVGGRWRGVSYPHIYRDMGDNFIGRRFPRRCCVKGSLFDRPIRYHDGAAHMNSSQAMCINFFQGFFLFPGGETVLLALLRDAGLLIPDGETVASAIFEYEPDPREGTNFDFYLILSNGQRFSFEVKFTESEFGGIHPDPEDPDKYRNKWRDVYRSMAAQSPYLAGCGQELFFAHYQINRNILYARRQDGAVFLTPRGNDGLQAGRAYIDSFGVPNIRNLYWEDLTAALLPMTADDPALSAYYAAFIDKYIAALPDPPAPPGSRERPTR